MKLLAGKNGVATGGQSVAAAAAPLWPRAALAGLMATTALPPFSGAGWLMVPALALLFGLLASSPQPARTGWWFGLAHQASLLHWLFLLGPDASMPRWLAPLTAAATILYAALFYALLGAAWGLARRWLGAAAALALAPLLWTGMETLRGLGELGFPWCLTGAAWLDTPLLPLAAAAGEQGLGAATAMTAAALAAWLGPSRGQPRRALLSAAAMATWAALVLGAAWRGPAPEAAGAAAARPPLRVAAIQANVALRDKWKPDRIDSTLVPHTQLMAQAAAAGAELAVWAETAVPSYLLHDPGLLGWVRGLAREHGLWLYAGFPHYTLTVGGEPARFNSSGLFRPDGVLTDRYDKHHLLPFGERLPGQRWFPALGRIDVGQAEWRPGAPPKPMRLRTAGGEYAFAGLICFESIFAGPARAAAREGIDFLVNITNDGWFGWTAGPRQHAALARLRAAECRLPVVRCANNGISFVTDARGRLIVRAGLDTRAVVSADVPPGPGGTLFVRAGAGPLWMWLALWAAAAGWPERRGRV